MASRYEEWMNRLRDHYGVEVVFDETHWKKEEIRLGDGRSLLSFSSEHLMVPMGRRYDALHKTLTPRFKIVQSKTISPFAKYTIFHIGRWVPYYGRYEICKGGMFTDTLLAATSCEWEARDYPWKDEYNRWFNVY